MEDLFYNEAKKWMSELNYSEHFYNVQKTSITFQSNNLGAKYPSITCFINEIGEKRCKLSDCVHFKMFLSLNSGYNMYLNLIKVRLSKNLSSIISW